MAALKVILHISFQEKLNFRLSCILKHSGIDIFKIGVKDE